MEGVGLASRRPLEAPLGQLVDAVLKVLFFEGFAKPEDQRSAEARNLLGSIKYLNGGLLLPYKVEQGNVEIRAYMRSTEAPQAYESLDSYCEGRARAPLHTLIGYRPVHLSNESQAAPSACSKSRRW